jgi:hypothetical protein
VNNPINWIDPWGLHGPGYALPPSAHPCISTGTCHYESNKKTPLVKNPLPDELPSVRNPPPNYQPTDPARAGKIDSISRPPPSMPACAKLLRRRQRGRGDAAQAPALRVGVNVQIVSPLTSILSRRGERRYFAGLFSERLIETQEELGSALDR